LANIDYRFELEQTSETSSIAKLKYCNYSKELYDVKDIEASLSWGERNSIALVLFMYYALQRNADLIILDDPISSFDKEKKFAILYRLFNIKKSVKSFKGKTVMLLTHDLEPIIDLKTKQCFEKTNGKQIAIGCAITNEEGLFKEILLDTEKDIMPTIMMYRSDYMDKASDIVFRVVALRLYLEYTEDDCKHKNIPYNILSCLMKCKPRSEINMLGNGTIKESEFDKGCTEIQRLLDCDDFDYEFLVKNEFSKEKIMEKYNNETNSYKKIQLFRAYYNSDKKDERKVNKENPVIKKFVDGSYHIENDYTHCLDYRKFNIIPNDIMNEVDKLMAELVNYNKSML